MDSDHLIEQKPENWCGTKISYNMNEADQAPMEDDVSALPDEQEYYPCTTQRGYMPTFDEPPHKSGGIKNASGIMVGMTNMVPRWTVNRASPTKLLYYVVRDGFKNDEDFRYTAACFKSAGDEWNALDFGVAILATNDSDQAHFHVKYWMPKEDDGTLAQAFFPNEVESVWVFDKTLSNSTWRKILHNTFLHEIGHILGLRHEFANDPNPKENNEPYEDRAENLGGRNPHSVMSYDKVNYINDQDKRDVKDFYGRANGSKINGVPITDYVPRPISRNKR